MNLPEKKGGKRWGGDAEREGQKKIPHIIRIKEKTC